MERTEEERIVDIFGHYTEFDEMYQADNSWFGSVIMGEDNEFEGIVEDYNQTDSYLVFGKVTDTGLSLTKCSKKDKDIPYVYDGDYEDGRFYGMVQAKNLYVEIPMGECKMSLLPADVTREPREEEKRDLKVKIARYKHDLGEIGNSLHESFEVSRIIGPVLVKK